MREITITKNDHDQRLDRFLIKYLSKAPKSLIQKYIRKKRVKINGIRAKSENIVFEGDIINIYVYDEELDKYTENRNISAVNYDLNIVYEDENIALINKPAGLLSHPSSSDDYGKTLVDSFVQYLIAKGEYVPRLEKSFTPALSNRLDRNTSGLVIGCKNHMTIKSMNEIIRDRKVDKYYITICKGKLPTMRVIESSLEKDDEKNMMKLNGDHGKKAKTIVRNILDNSIYSIGEIELITGRTHQIRAHLSSIGHPIIGDKKYGDKNTNRFLEKEYRLRYQLLHSYRLVFNELDGGLSYLSGREFIAGKSDEFKRIEEGIFNEVVECQR